MSAFTSARMIARITRVDGARRGPAPEPAIGDQRHRRAVITVSAKSRTVKVVEAHRGVDADDVAIEQEAPPHEHGARADGHRRRRPTRSAADGQLGRRARDLGRRAPAG